MVLRAGTLIPFQFGGINKLVEIKFGLTTENDIIKHAIRTAFGVSDFKLYNKKIGFEIPEEFFYSYLNQRHDYTNFVIEIVASDDISSKESSSDVETMSQSSNKSTSELLNPDGNSLTKKAKRNPLNYLQEILDTPEGRVLCYGVSYENCLSDEHQTLLAKLMALREIDMILKSDAPLAISNQRYLGLARTIWRKFPNEGETIYYDRPFKNVVSLANGKLCDEFNSAKCRYLRNHAGIRYRQGGKIIQDDFPELDELHVLKEDYSLYLKAWQNTHELRMIYVNNIEDPLIYYRDFMNRDLEYSCDKFIEYDFERLHPGKERKLLDNWEQISERLFTEALVSGRKDVPLILDLYGNMPQLSSFMMFSYFLENYECDIQSFKKDNLRNLVIHIDSMRGYDMNTFMKYYKKQSKLKPRVFVTGKSPEELKCYVFMDNFVHFMKSVLEAVDFCFKYYQALQLSYLDEQSQAWSLIQNAVYDIHSRKCDAVDKSFFDILRTT